MDKAYHRYIKAAVVSGLLGFVFPGGHAVARQCAISAAGLKGVDMVFRAITVGQAHGDLASR